MKCVLCDQTSRAFYQNPKNQFTYYHCPHCDLRFLDPGQRLSNDDEHARYKQHNNIVTDVDYQNFVRPLFDVIVQTFPKNARGLDYGCGPGPVLTHLLKLEGYDHIDCFDPYFRPEPDYLKNKYDFIYAIEVAEHFYYPSQEFKKLKNLLSPGGSLGLMTSLFTENLDFSTWYYKNDPTHVCLYSPTTIKWIATQYGFISHKIEGNRNIWFYI